VHAHPLIPIVAIRFAALVIAATLSVAPLSTKASAGSQLQPDSEGQVMLLPPMLVREHNGPKWLYASVAGIEVLSRCGDISTKAFINAFLLRRLELEQLLPASLQVGKSVPLALILITPRVENTMNEELVRSMNKDKSKQTAGYITSEASAVQVYLLVRTIPQLMLSDSDSTGMVCTLDPEQRGPVNILPGLEMDGGFASALFKGLEDNGTYRDINFTSERIGSILGDRVPPLPSWFKTGFLSLYQQINWTDSEKIMVNPVFWVSNALTRQILRNANFTGSMEEPMKSNDGSGPYASTSGIGPGRAEDTGLAFLPMQQLFAGPLGGATPLTPEETTLWNSQVSLFLHWAFADQKRRAALWKFVDLSSRQPVTEDLIRQCFGMGSASLAQSLKVYLPDAMRSQLTLIDVNALNIPAFELKDATEVDVARIKGDMGRREIMYVKDRYPIGVAKYVEQVGAVLNGPSDDGENAPALLAVRGLYNCDIGKYEEARPLLEAAAAAHVARPTLYLELAKIRYKDALAQPTGTDGKLGPDQVAQIIRLLRESRLYAPAQVETYALAINTWNQSAILPSRENLGLLNEGVEFFPTSFDLISGAAKLYVQCGLRPEAIQLIDRGIQCADPNSTAWSRLMAFRTQL